MKIILVVGARPNFVKIAPIVRELMAREECAKRLTWKLVHTGQHYDYEMSQSFFDKFEIPNPDYFLNVGSGSHAEQTAKVMMEFERVCREETPDIVVVVGDVNSTLACSIVAKKMGITVAHVEAGLRSGDMSMPEEINRVVTDSISDLLFVTERSGVENLKREGKGDSQVYLVGNVMIDSLFWCLKKMPNMSAAIQIPAKPYAVMTLHRPSNVDSKNNFGNILGAVKQISKDLPIIFPVHPRTRKNIEELGIDKFILDSNISLLEPLSYFEFLLLWKNANLVLTDSGGIQEETTALKIPCLTLRNNTERPVTVEEGTNRLAGTTTKSILETYADFKKYGCESARIPKLWDGNTAKRIIDVIIDKL